MTENTLYKGWDILHQIKELDRAKHEFQGQYNTGRTPEEGPNPEFLTRILAVRGFDKLPFTVEEVTEMYQTIIKNLVRAKRRLEEEFKNIEIPKEEPPFLAGKEFSPGYTGLLNE